MSRSVDGKRSRVAKLLAASITVGALAMSGLPRGADHVDAAPIDRTLVATEDTQVNSADRVTPLGDSTKMTLCTACNAVGGPTKRGIIKFDISGVGPVQRARLRLYSLGSAPSPVEVQETTTNWSEATVNWTNAPIKGADLGVSTGGEPAGWIEIELVRVGTGAYVIETPGGVPIRIASSETTTPPQLIVTVDGPPPPPASRMNVLLIVTDDQRDWDSTKVMMPKTAGWIGGGGRTFTQAFATTPSCCPSRASIMSGRYVHNHGVKRQGEAADFDQALSIQKLLKDNGYQTAIAGKMLNGWDLNVKPAFFDRSAVAGGGYYNEYWGVDGVKQLVPTYSTTYIQNKGLEYVDSFETNDAAPWFIYLAPFAPHKPHVPETKYATASVPAWANNAGVNDSNSDKPAYLSWMPPIPQANLDSFRTAQQRTLLSVDDMVDAMMRKLTAKGELDNTLVIFTSDNGYHWGEQRYIGKFTPYRPSVHVPMLVRWPGQFSPGSFSSNLVANIDLAPTITKAAGITVDANRFDGRPLTSGTPRSRLLLEYYYDTNNGLNSAPTWRSTLTPNYQFVESFDAAGTPFYEYYNRAVDPWLTTNLYKNATTADDPPLAPLAATVSADQSCWGANCP